MSPCSLSHSHMVSHRLGKTLPWAECSAAVNEVLGKVIVLDAICDCPAGQGNYGYANSVCDMLCMSRRAAGKPALAIAWGPVDHVGYVAEILKV